MDLDKMDEKIISKLRLKSDLTTTYIIRDSVLSENISVDSSTKSITVSGAISALSGFYVGDKKVATETYVDDRISSVIGTAPEALDTLKELADAISGDANFAGTVVNELGKKANITDIPTGLNQLTNDAGFITDYTETDPVYSAQSGQFALKADITGFVSNDNLLDLLSDEGFVELDDDGRIPSSLLPEIPDSVTKTSDLTNDSGFATSSYVDDRIQTIVGAAPEALDTLKEIADAISGDASFATTILDKIENKADSSIYKLSGIALGSENSANYTVAVGTSNTIGSSSNYSLVIGTNNTLSNSRCCVIGQNLQTSSSNQIVIGKYNEKNSDAIFIVGNGTTGSGNKKNAFIIDKDSNVSIKGNLSVEKNISILGMTISGDLVFDESHVIDKDKIEFWNNKEDHGFTSFKVWASTFKINSGVVSGLVMMQKNKMIEIYGDWVNDISLYAQIPSGMTEAFLLRTTDSNYSDSDVYVDWGDGNTSTVASAEFLYNYNTDSESSYLMSHTYGNEGTYIVKIFGKKYFSINHSLSSSNTNGIYTEPQNIVCDAISKKYNIASNITNLASMFKASKKLLKIDAAYSGGLSNLVNCSNIFSGCKNLYEVKNLTLPSTIGGNSNAMFGSCSNLTNTNITIPLMCNYAGLKSLFNGCSKLSADISSFFTQSFIMKNLNVNSMFKTCSSLYGTVPADKLWEDSSITWLDTTDCFTGCSNEIRSQVPTSWGGTNEEIENAIQNGTYTKVTKNYVDNRISSEISGISNVFDLNNKLSASFIEEDENHKFVTVSQITNWNATIDKVNDVISGSEGISEIISTFLTSEQGEKTLSTYLNKKQDLINDDNKLDYSMLSGNVPTKVSDLTNDSGYITSSYQGLLALSGISTDGEIITSENIVDVLSDEGFITLNDDGTIPSSLLPSAVFNGRTTVEITDTTVSIDVAKSGTDYHLGQITSLTILSADISDIEITVSFSSGSTAATLSITNDLNHSAVEIPEANCIYRLSILNGVAIGLNFEANA